MTDQRELAIRIARNMLDLKPVYIDTETTGFEISDMVVEIAILDTDGEILFENLVKPIKSIPGPASRVHGITDLDVASAPTWPEIWPQMREIVLGRVAAFYNAEFDLKMIRQSCGLTGIAWEYPFEDDFCVMELFARYFGELGLRRGTFRWKNLAFAGNFFRLPEPNSHRARDDAQLTRLVLEKMAE
jgi:DNA polymerase-3 subunit epsilon